MGLIWCLVSWILDSLLVRFDPRVCRSALNYILILSVDSFGEGRIATGMGMDMFIRLRRTVMDQAKVKTG
jgi:hypothetical protein